VIFDLCIGRRGGVMSLVNSLRELMGWPTAGRKEPSRRSGPRSRGLALESLESRCLLSYSVTNLGTLPGGVISVATAINNAGDITGYSNSMGSTTHSAFLYRDGHMSSLGELPGYPGGTGLGLNDADQVVGDGYTLDPIKHHAFLYSDGEMTDLGTL